jgi:hypothetical protein
MHLPDLPLPRFTTPPIMALKIANFKLIVNKQTKYAYYLLFDIFVRQISAQFKIECKIITIVLYLVA